MKAKRHVFGIILILLFGLFVSSIYYCFFFDPVYKLKGQSGDVRVVRDTDLEKLVDIDLKEKLEELEEDYAIAKEKVAEFETENLNLKSRLNSLISEREQRIVQGNELKNKFLVFDQLSNEQKSDLIIRIYDFLSDQKNPDDDRSISLLVSEIINSEKNRKSNEKILALEEKVKELQSRNERLLGLLKTANLDLRNLKKNQKLLEGLLGEAREQITIYEARLNEYRNAIKDTTAVLSGTIKRNQDKFDSLKNRVNLINSELAKVSPVRLTQFDLIPVGAKRNKNGTYKSRQAVNGIRLQMRMAYNKPVSESSQRLEIKYFLRIKQKGKEDLVTGSEFITATEKRTMANIIGKGLRFLGPCSFEVYCNNVLVAIKTIRFE